jgi:hypothetical protein
VSLAAVSSRSKTHVYSITSLAQIAIGDSDLINVRLTQLCGLKSDISRGPRSANSDIRLGCACTGSVPRASIALADEIAFHLIKKQFR